MAKRRIKSRKKARSLADIKFPVIADAPDIRDRIYKPALIRVSDSYPDDLSRDLHQWKHGQTILDQGNEGACTGFSLAAVINELYRRRGVAEFVSPYMLYDMAKRYDEWDGEEYEGSSLRGALRGWHNAGACSQSLWGKKGKLTMGAAREARKTRLGAYYRLRPELNDFQVALNEVGILYVSASTHDGWDVFGAGSIKFQSTSNGGGHAFAVVGYNQEGFIVLNSWGEEWGVAGMAVWSYEDWSANLTDAWVVQLAARTPNAFGLFHQKKDPITDAEVTVQKSSTKRIDIAGHFVHIDDGQFHENGSYWSTRGDIAMTAAHVAQSQNYDHLLFYAHGGLNSPKASAARILAMKDGFKRNRIYPFHFMYDTGLMEELKDLIKSKVPFLRARVGGLSDWTDRAIERVIRKPGKMFWDEMKRDARIAFRTSGAGTKTVIDFLNALDTPGAVTKKIHLVGHSTGGILLAFMLQRLNEMGRTLKVQTMSLLAPANSITQYEEVCRPLLGTDNPVKIGVIYLYVLSEKRELDDDVAKAYRKSLLYLVSNAFEPDREAPLLGMKKFHRLLEGANKLKVLVAGDGSQNTDSESHGGFDNDEETLNTILRTILDRQPAQPFTKLELSY